MSAKDPSPGGSSSPENQEDLALLVHSSCAKIEEDDVRKCSSCSRRKPTSDFSGKATCDQCRVKKRKHCATAVLQAKHTLDSLQIENGILQGALREKNQEIDRLQRELKYTTGLLIHQMVPLETLQQQVHSMRPPFAEPFQRRPAQLLLPPASSGHMSAPPNVAWKPVIGPAGAHHPVLLQQPVLQQLNHLTQQPPAGMPVDLGLRGAVPEDVQMFDIADIAFESFFPPSGATNDGSGEGAGRGSGSGSEWELRRCDTLMGPRTSTDSEYQSPTHSECQSPVSSKWESVAHTECDGCARGEYTNPNGEYKINTGEHAEEKQQQLGLWVHNPPVDDSSVTDPNTLGEADSDSWSWLQRSEWLNHAASMLGASMLECNELHRMGSVAGGLGCYSLIIFQLASLPLLYSMPMLLISMAAFCFYLAKLEKHHGFASAHLNTVSATAHSCKSEQQADTQSWTRSNSSRRYPKHSIRAHSLPELYHRRGSWP